MGRRDCAQFWERSTFSKCKTPIGAVCGWLLPHHRPPCQSHETTHVIGFADRGQAQLASSCKANYILRTSHTSSLHGSSDNGALVDTMLVFFTQRGYQRLRYYFNCQRHVVVEACDKIRNFSLALKQLWCFKASKAPFPSTVSVSVTRCMIECRWLHSKALRGSTLHRSEPAVGTSHRYAQLEALTLIGLSHRRTHNGGTIKQLCAPLWQGTHVFASTEEAWT